MDPTVLELLKAVDDPDDAEHPPGFDWAALRARVSALQPVLEQIAGRPFVLFDGAQDASFFGDLSILTAGPQPNWFDTVFAIRFSNFGSLFTTWSHGPERLPDAITAELVAAVKAAGFRFVRREVLEEPYTGVNNRFRCMTWWNRFFEWL